MVSGVQLGGHGANVSGGTLIRDVLAMDAMHKDSAVYLSIFVPSSCLASLGIPFTLEAPCAQRSKNFSPRR